MSYEVHAIPALKDNYIWVLIQKNRAIVVDPGDAAPVIDFFEREKLDLAAILLTHHHADHTGGVEKLKTYYSCPVYASNAYATHPIQKNVSLSIEDYACKVLAIPGHTLDHIAYYDEKNLFCGDTLFAAGCGRVFEGTNAQMYASLQTLLALPPTTKVYCGHEYTLKNLLFAQTVEPNNAMIKHKLEKIRLLREKNSITLPSTIEEENHTNPFLRCTQPSVILSAEKYAKRKLLTEVEVFASLRDWKNNF